MIKKKQFVIASFIALAVLCIIFIAGIAVGARYRSELADTWDKLLYERHVTLEHGNLFTDGVEGFINDVNKKLYLPKELYIGEEFGISFDRDGEIEYIRAYVQGYNIRGKLRQYFITFDRANSDKLTVRTDPWYGEVIRNEKKLSPLFAMVDSTNFEKILTDSVPGAWWYLEYTGQEKLYPEDGPICLSADVDGDGTISDITDVSGLHGGYMTGYTMYITDPGQRRQAYIAEPIYTSQEQIDAERDEQTISDAKDSNSWVMDNYDGATYYFLPNDQDLGWRLVIADAALGSRFYTLERTVDGGESWDQINGDPFNGSYGVAEGIVFFDDNLGFAGLAGASQDNSKMYITHDGGKTFSLVTLPVDTVTEIPESGQELGKALEDYDYCRMPEKNGDEISITMTLSNDELDGIVFVSEDQGKTWFVR